jgi:RNA polymerase sigma-70 factor, ECF subfamily
MSEAYWAEASVPGESERPVRSYRLGADGRVSAEELASLYRDNYHRFVRLADAITRDPEEARDAVQEGFSSALRELGRYEGRGSFEGWVWRCVLNAARMSRRRSVRRSLPLRWERHTAPSLPDESEPKLLEQIAHLPERQRLALFLRYFGDLSYDRIAEVLEVSPGTVAASLNAAHRTLRQQLEEAEND